MPIIKIKLAMKAILFFLSLLWGLNLWGQYNFNSVKIKSSDLPPAVLETYHRYYPHQEVKHWEKLTRTHLSVTYNKYVAVLLDEGGLITRARIKEDGLALMATVYYRGKNRNKVPDNIKNYATQNHSDYKLVEVEKTLYFEDNSSYYRLFLQKTTGYLYLYLDLAGQLIPEENIPLEVKEEDAWAK